LKLYLAGIGRFHSFARKRKGYAAADAYWRRETISQTCLYDVSPPTAAALPAYASDLDRIQWISSHSRPEDMCRRWACRRFPSPVFRDEGPLTLAPATGLPLSSYHSQLAPRRSQGVRRNRIGWGGKYGSHPIRYRTMGASNTIAPFVQERKPKLDWSPHSRTCSIQG
jgi:hypothetical protein